MITYLHICNQIINNYHAVRIENRTQEYEKKINILNSRNLKRIKIHYFQPHGYGGKIVIYVHRKRIMLNAFNFQNVPLP